MITKCCWFHENASQLTFFAFFTAFLPLRKRKELVPVTTFYRILPLKENFMTFFRTKSEFLRRLRPSEQISTKMKGWVPLMSLFPPPPHPPPPRELDRKLLMSDAPASLGGPGSLILNDNAVPFTIYRVTKPVENENK